MKLPHQGALPKLTLLLAGLCLAVAAAAVTYTAWSMFGPTRRPMLQGWDDSFYYFWLPATVIDHDLDFARLLATAGTVTPAARTAGLAQPRTPTGLLPNKYPPGWALGSLPFFLLVRVFSPAGSTGFEPPYLLAVWVGQILYAAGGLWLAVRIVQRMVPGAPASVAVLAVWLASPLVYYQTSRVSMPHSQVFVLALAVFWLTLRAVDGDRRGRVWLALGFAGALLVVTRNIAIVYLAFPAALLFPNLRSWRTWGWLAAGAVGPVAVQLAAWKVLFGSWIAYSYGGEGFDFRHLHLAEVLFSPRHGWFYWHPLMLVGVLGLIWRIRGQPARWPWLASLGAIVILNAAWPTWWFASSFGNRGVEVPVFFAMWGVAVLLHKVRNRPAWRRVLAGATALAVVWNLALLALFLTQRIPREAPVTYGDDARALSGWLAGEPRR